jgi:hypothetical protein
MSYTEVFDYLQEGDPSKLCRMTVSTKLIVFTNLLPEGPADRRCFKELNLND